MWKYRELLPWSDDSSVVSLGESMTPLLAAPSMAASFGVGEILVKDESLLPTASFKARGLAMAVTMAREFGVTDVALPTNGNAGAALAAYAARANITAHIFCPDITPPINIAEMSLAGANVFTVSGLIDDCGQLVREGERIHGWFNCATLREPYRIEGKKTMGLELAEQLDWTLPDAIFFPTGGGTAVIGMWKAFDELEALGWIGPKRPRMYAIQAEGCAPLVQAFDHGDKHAQRWDNASTVASGIRVPVALGDFIILDILRRSGGAALSVSDTRILNCRAVAGAADGLLMCPEGAAALIAVEDARQRGMVHAKDRVVVFNCAAATKYPIGSTARQIELQTADSIA
jgi:threonine synthase